MKTIVLDDDPTGTQSAADVRVLLAGDSDSIEAALLEADSVYLQTNSRSLPEEEAVALIQTLRRKSEEAAARLAAPVRFVLRGDSTLRGHVFAETEVLLGADSLMLFVPAFPAGGRTTVDGVHLVRVGERTIPAHETEYADDPVFPFSTAVLEDYVAQRSARPTERIPLEVVRNDRLPAVLTHARAGVVLIPDAETDDDIDRIAEAVDSATAAGRSIVVRSAAPLAAALAGVRSRGLLPVPLTETKAPALLVCGSHTRGATQQLEAIAPAWGVPATVSTALALADAGAAGETAGSAALEQLASRPLALLATERYRRTEHGTLDHGKEVMEALILAVRRVLPHVDVVIAKGGITSADVAAAAIGATSAWVLGQVLPGVSVWRLRGGDDRERLYVVVPGNVGEPGTLQMVLDALHIVPGDPVL